MNLLDKMPVYDMDGNQIQYLVQWDRGVTVRLKDTGLTEAQPVHFYHAKDECSKEADGSLDGGDLIATIPNAILRSPAPVCGFVYKADGKQNRSILGFRIPVVPRSRPKDYDFDDQPRLYYYSYDGSELLYEEPVEEGGDGAWDGEPERASTPQYSYAFTGWSRSTGSTAGDASATKNVTSDRNVYAAYTATVRTYTVRFYNADELLQETVVPYGGSAAYTGDTPSYAEPEACFAEEDYAFLGWVPLPENITGDTDCIAQFSEPVFEVKEITDSWEEIIKACDSGNTTAYHLGNYKPLDLGDEGVIHMQIAAKRWDTVADTNEKAPLSWVSMELLKSKCQITAGGVSGYTSNALYAHIRDDITPLVPSELIDAIKTVYKSTAVSDGNTSNIDGKDYALALWTPDVYEVANKDTTNHNAPLQYAVYYKQIFPDQESRIRCTVDTDTPTVWWLRTTGFDSRRAYYRVSADGGLYKEYSTATLGVAIGFCT